MGIFSRLFSPSKKRQRGTKTYKFQGYSLKKFRKESVSAEAEGNYELAIELLTEGKREYSCLSDFFALPKLLQRAGKIQLAIQDVKNTFTIIPALVQKESPHLTYRQKVSTIYHGYSETFNAMRIFTKNTNENSLFTYAFVMIGACRLAAGKHSNIPYWVNWLEIENWGLDLLPKSNKIYEIKKQCELFIDSHNLQEFNKNLCLILNVEPFEIISTQAMTATCLSDTYRKTRGDRLCLLSKSGQLFLDSGLEYWGKNDFNMARMMFTKVGYTIKTMETESSYREKRKVLSLKKKLLDIQLDFALNDPLYQEMIKDIIVILNKHHRILQTEIYPMLKFSKSDIMYVLYYADKLNDVKRTKKGRTYELFSTRLYLSGEYVPKLSVTEKINPYSDL